MFNQGRTGRKGKFREENIVGTRKTCCGRKGGWVEGPTLIGQEIPVDL